mmetsp:Transcript_3663/g.13699  ORF Transcript_3663/g.13699 Transcript_3663/m.13699 type:complete len:122 (-) Transcript_3663:841-1206(-)
MSAITASITTARAAPATRAVSNAERARKAAAVSEKKDGVADDVFGRARKAATTAFAAAVLVTAQPNAALAEGSILDAIPPAPSNGPLKNLPRGEHAPLVQFQPGTRKVNVPPTHPMRTFAA